MGEDAGHARVCGIGFVGETVPGRVSGREIARGAVTGLFFVSTLAPPKLQRAGCRTSAAKAVEFYGDVNAALKRCATEKRLRRGFILSPLRGSVGFGLYPWLTPWAFLFRRFAAG